METPYHPASVRTFTFGDQVVRRVLLPLIIMIGLVGLVQYAVLGSGSGMGPVPPPLPQTTIAP